MTKTFPFRQKAMVKKSRTRKTLNHSTNADISTNAKTDKILHILAAQSSSRSLVVCWSVVWSVTFVETKTYLPSNLHDSSHSSEKSDSSDSSYSSYSSDSSGSGDSWYSSYSSDQRTFSQTNLIFPKKFETKKNHKKLF